MHSGVYRLRTSRCGKILASFCCGFFRPKLPAPSLEVLGLELSEA